MALTSTIYTYFPTNAFKKLVSDMSAEATTIKCALLTSSYTPNMDTHESYNNVSTYEVTGVGYTATGAEITTKTLTLGTGTVVFDGADVQWTTSTITARYGFVYDSTPAGATDKKAILLVDFGENYSTTAATFKIVWNASGLFSVTVS